MEMLATATAALGDAFGVLLTAEHIMFLFAGVLLGLSVGVFPGLGGIAGLSLVLPFMFGLDPVSGLALMVGLVAVIPTSDTFASVLMGIPGSSASQATVLDGFPLSRQGQAARALGAAFVSSLYGGLIGAVILTAFVLVARPLILTFRTPELLMLTVLAFSMVGVLAGRSLSKGLAAAGLGMLIGSIGAAPAQGSMRMDFGSWYLGDGLQLVIVALGVFAVPEIINLLRGDRAIAGGARLGRGWLHGILDWWRNLFLSTRCAGIGVVVGVIPGLGGSVVDWVAYGHTVQTTRDRSRFGKGEIRGVIGPESSNNAKEGGGLVPTLLFGIPGSGSMAVFLGGMVLLGLEAGPSMVQFNLDTTYTIVWSLALANVAAAGLCLFLSPWIARLTTISFPVLAPFLFMVVLFASFQSRQTLWDLLALLVIGVLGIFMKRFDWPRPAFLIGFVLAAQAEVYTYQVTQFVSRRGIDYLLTWPVGIILLLTVVSVWLGARQSQHLAGNGAARTWPWNDRWPQIAFTGLIAAYAAVAAIDAWSVRVLIDRVFPLAVGLFTLAATLVVLAQQVTGRRPAVLADDEIVGEESRDAGRRGVWTTLSWLVGLTALTALVGFFAALIVFFATFLRLRARQGWLRVGLLTVLGCGGMLLLASSLNRDFPSGVIQSFWLLPWPFR